MTRPEFVDFVRASFNAMDTITPAEGATAVLKAFDELALVEYVRVAAMSEVWMETPIGPVKFHIGDIFYQRVEK